MKLIALLWALSLKMFYKSRVKDSVREHLGDKHIVFQLQTHSGWICRNFTVSNRKISSAWGRHDSADIVISFNDAKYGAEVLTSETKRLAFMEGIRDKKVTIEGDLSLFLWYVELGTLLNS